MFSRDNLKIFLEELLKQVLPTVPLLHIQTRLEHDARSTRLFFTVSRKLVPDKEVGKMDIEFFSVTKEKKAPRLQVDTHIYILTDDLTDDEFKALLLLHVGGSFLPYQFFNNQK